MEISEMLTEDIKREMCDMLENGGDHIRFEALWNELDKRAGRNIKC